MLRPTSTQIIDLAIILSLTSGLGFAQVQTKREAGFLSGKYYGTVEVRHHLNTHYENDTQYLQHQEPSLHLRGQFGGSFYDQFLDIYATFGVFKTPRTQRITQRRPELELDLYPINSQYFRLLQYNFVRFPIANAPDEYTDDDRIESDVDATTAGSVIVVGLSPTAFYPFNSPYGSFKLKSGADGWTKLYSRTQFTDEVDDQRDARLGLAEEEPQEDYAMHYRLKGFAGFDYQPPFAGLKAGLEAHYVSRFNPTYVRYDTGTDHKYSADRYSYYRARIKYQVSERIKFINDFYHFHGGFFARKRHGGDRRYRNILRLACSL